MVVEDASDEVVGTVDLGRGLVKDRAGGTAAEIMSDGTCIGNRGTRLGSVDGIRDVWGAGHGGGLNGMKMVGLYLLILNTQFVHEDSAVESAVESAIELTVEPAVASTTGVASAVGGQEEATEGHLVSDKPSPDFTRLHTLVRMEWDLGNELVGVERWLARVVTSTAG